VTIKAWLEGNAFDLQDLAAALLASGDVRVVRDEAIETQADAYYLTAPEIDSPPAGKAYYEVAQRLLPLVNGLARARDANFQSVWLADRYTLDDGQVAVIASGVLRGRGRLAGNAAVARVNATASGTVTHGGKPVPQPPPPWPARLALADTNADVAEALPIFGQAEPLGGVELWKIFEIIRESIKPDTVATLGWITQPDWESFKEAVHRPDVSGELARHARRPDQPQHRKMEMAEARSRMSTIVAKWLGQLAGNG
jgi:hypothetical protein